MPGRADDDDHLVPGTGVAGRFVQQPSNNTPESRTQTRIRLTAGETVRNATLDDNATARDFASLLPLTLRMNDLLKREKYAHLSRSLAAGGEPRFSYEIGHIAGGSAVHPRVPCTGLGVGEAAQSAGRARGRGTRAVRRWGHQRDTASGGRSARGLTPVRATARTTA
jgi:hypothetical protein